MPTTVVNAKVFDGVESRPWASVRFDAGVITAVGTAAQNGDDVVDARGGTLLPGLIDAHAHLIPGALQRSLNFGVTTVLDMFSTPEVVAAARRQARTRGDVADVRSSGIGATAPGGHPSAMYPPFPTLTGPDEAERFVAQRVAEGSDYLKVFAGPGGLWPALDDATVAALAAAARASGLTVVAHVSSIAGLEHVVAAGVDVVAHVPADADLPARLVERIAAAGIVVGPTLATIVGTRGGASAVAERNVRRLADAGVVLLAGTDAPNPAADFGVGLHRELQSLVRAGTSPAQALAAATSAAARAFRLDDRGRIAVGLRADLLLVSGDPLVDIAATLGIERIWRAGAPFERRPFVPTAAEAEELAVFDARVAAAVAAVRRR